MLGARVIVKDVTHLPGGVGKFTLLPVTGDEIPEDQRFGPQSRSDGFSIVVPHAAAQAQLFVGHEYYLRLDRVDGLPAPSDAVATGAEGAEATPAASETSPPAAPPAGSA